MGNGSAELMRLMFTIDILIALSIRRLEKQEKTKSCWSYEKRILKI
jgi:hypothetical protein